MPAQIALLPPMRAAYPPLVPPSTSRAPGVPQGSNTSIDS